MGGDRYVQGRRHSRPVLYNGFWRNLMRYSSAFDCRVKYERCEAIPRALGVHVPSPACHLGMTGERHSPAPRNLVSGQLIIGGDTGTKVPYRMGHQVPWCRFSDACGPRFDDGDHLLPERGRTIHVIEADAVRKCFL
jgi:hypothetical protein